MRIKPQMAAERLASLCAKFRLLLKVYDTAQTDAGAPALHNSLLLLSHTDSTCRPICTVRTAGWHFSKVSDRPNKSSPKRLTNVA